MVLIPKGNREFIGIGLVEVLWKLLSGVINWQIGVEVQFNNIIHGFQAGQGTCTNSLKDKLIQHLTAMREEVLYEVLLDLWKAYDSLDRERCMEIIAENVVSPQTERIL